MRTVRVENAHDLKLNLNLGNDLKLNCDTELLTTEKNRI